MIVLKHTKTFENCPNGCESISYLKDNQEDKNCLKCFCTWNRLTNEIYEK